MKRAWGRPLLVAVLVAVLASVSLGTPRPAAADDPAPVTITWPEITQFNPDHTSYVVNIEGGDPDAHYRLRGGTGDDFGVVQDFVGPGQQVVNFLGDGPGGVLTLRIYSCNAEFTECTQHGSSPELTVWRRLKVDHYIDSLGPVTPIRLETEPVFVYFVDVAWSVLDDGVPVAEGEALDVPADGPVPPIGPQPALVEGHSYEFRMTVSAEVVPYGRLTATTSQVVVWDTIIDPTLDIELLDDDGDTEGRPSNVVYALFDGYGDWLRFASRDDDVDTLSVSFKDADGNHVNAIGEHGTDYFLWSGRFDSYYPLAEGRYTATITLRDRALNEAVFTRRVRVSYERPVRKVWRRSVTPAASLDVIPRPDCGWLRRPGRADWPTSFGYRSQRECGTLDSFSQTIHEVKVPVSVNDQYRKVRLTVIGGAARSARGSRLNWDVSPNGLPGLIEDNLFSGFVGRHTSPWEYGTIDYRGDDRFARWTVASRLGSRYDVKRFVIEVEYYVLG